MKVLIARDRESAGGGIVIYYEALKDYFKMEMAYTPVGKAYAMYASSKVPFLLRFTLTRLLLDYLALVYKIVRFRPDVVLLNSSLARGGRAIARDLVNIVIAKIMRQKVVLFWHGFLGGAIQFPFIGGNKGVVCRIYKRCDAFIVLATRFRENLQQWGFKKPVFVETTTIGKELIEDGTIKQRQPPANKRSLLFLSRVIKEKGIMELIDAYGALKQQHPGYELFVAGDGEDRGSAIHHVSERGIKDVHFLGHITGDRKFRAFENASIFCFPSYYDEGMPLAVLEAMALGLPLVTSQAGGLRDKLEDGQNGIILERIDSTAVAKGIAELVANDELRERISAHNRRCAMEIFHPQKCARRLEQIVGTVVAGPRSGAGSSG